MDFGDILDAWDEETAKPRGKSKKNAGSNGTAHSPDLSGSSGRTGSYSQSARDDLPVANPLDVWLRRYGVTDKDAEPDFQEEPPHVKRRRLRAMRSEASIDLHGLTREEAWIRLEAFFADCVRRNLQKVLIIHGKGTHSSDDPVLKTMVQHFLEANAHAGESGYSAPKDGGSGSTWVILK
ncbi:MAG TPA: Smr/MutS family protein [Treponemataceae bacterium]|jgi:DNA-nicking Smr family endonuclease|nr:Smr/MutS family protein [Treponemataceae bacterium]HOU37899.1 Smr/MutS family protein [Treponemataceae bacterium]HPA09634.1 Smr/MutS family protein [Treponemataceae bacterium]HPL90715.1 Smr/MutS family protein [Treponemataceae bacterium]HPX13512.1 Smr/MutS family protein [Treponemataceae bacterium]